MLSLFNTVPWAVVLAWVASTLIPEISALLTPYKGGITGVVTALLSLVAGVAGELAHSTDMNWKKAIGAAFVSWLVATNWHSKVLNNTRLEKSLHATGVVRK